MVIIRLMLLVLWLRLVIKWYCVKLASDINFNVVLFGACFLKSLLNDNWILFTFCITPVSHKILRLSLISIIPFPDVIQWQLKHGFPNFVEVVFEISNHYCRLLRRILIPIEFALNHIFDKVHSISMFNQVFVAILKIRFWYLLEIFPHSIGLHGSFSQQQIYILLLNRFFKPFLSILLSVGLVGISVLYSVHNHPFEVKFPVLHLVQLENGTL